MHVKAYRSPFSRYEDVFAYVPVEECAKRMQITPKQVVKLVKSGALRHTGGFGVMLVEPAVLV
jgi:hypothetical protein